MLVTYFIAFIILLSQDTVFNLCSAQTGPVVNTTLGRIKGTIMESFQGKSIYAFRGIPYAQPPIGNLRFAAPQPIQQFEYEIFQATADSAICPQPLPYFNMDEDCLTLNVYTKDFDAKLPVIVYIHGGANVLGSGSSVYGAGPQYLMDHDVVYVAFNYRLGALGYLRTSGDNVKGNFGYLDQLLVLKWVNEHIANFGGDPDNVTIMGLSAGSIAVSLHLASPLSKNLFHRAILMSGSATNHFANDNAYWTRKLAREISCPMYDPVDVVECLRGVTWEKIIEICGRWEPYSLVNQKWIYEIDDYFMPEHPTALIEKGEFNRVPLLVSFTENELDYSVNYHLDYPLLLDDFNVNFVEYAPEMFTFDYNLTRSQKIKDFYLGDNLTQFNNENIEDLGRIFSDAILGHGIYRLVQLARKYTDVYYTRIDYVGQLSTMAPLTEDNVYKGVAHGDDLQYVVPSFLELMPTNGSDVFMMERITEWFTNFAKTGSPVSSSENWPPCNSTVMNLLYNDVNTTLGLPAYTDRYELWDELFPTPGSAKGGAINLSGSQLSVFMIAIATGVTSWLMSIN
ncbi:juvenile hormone esterase-like [Drosophila tropicalis]|uniref:juvenile hormone esterase-like n=1 Tax=Drosophila tropicalis TaxID=46794 RepID=UPI0035AC0703